MTDRDALLRAVLAAPAAPEDDAPRLIFADWLEENGEAERAEFIRVQCELARLGPPPLVVTEKGCVLSGRLGPDYFQLLGTGDMAHGGRLAFEAKVGDRVDVLHPVSLMNKPKKPLYGLRVHAIQPEVVLVRDAESKPWAGKALKERERELFDLSRPWWGLPLDWTIHLGPHIYVRTAFIRRGFVSSVTLSLATFVGGACGQCLGNGVRPSYDGGRNFECDCVDGRTPGIAARLFREQPVTRVTLSDRNPRNVGRDEWWWSRPLHPEEDRLADWVLPLGLWKLLEGYDQSSEYVRLNELQPNKYYPSAEAAKAALSAACVKFGRKAAGMTEEDQIKQTTLGALR